jgi:hypothetical protein
MKAMARRPLVLSLLAVALLAAGCGSTTVRHITTTITRSATAAAPSATTPTTPTSATGTSSSSPSSTATGATSTAAARSQVAARSPRAIVAAAAKALRTSGGYAMRADLRENGTRSRLTLTADGPRTYEATLTDRGVVTGLIGLPTASYLRGNVAFWRSHVGNGSAQRARAGRLAGRWLKLTASGARSVTKTLGSLSPSVLARCLTEDHGTLTLAGRTTIGHTRAMVVKDAGDAPGATPSTIVVATGGPPYPLRYTATGRTRPGGRIDVCNDGKGEDSEGTITFNEFGHVPEISAPTGAGGGTTI